MRSFDPTYCLPYCSKKDNLGMSWMGPVVQIIKFKFIVQVHRLDQNFMAMLEFFIQFVLFSLSSHRHYMGVPFIPGIFYFMFHLLAPSGALVFIMVYYISASKPLFQIFQILQILKWKWKWKDPTCAIFLKSMGFEDIEYDIPVYQM